MTERDEYGNADIIGVDSAELQLNLEFDELNRVTDALNRLAGYEDTGLTPAQIHRLKAKYEALESDKNTIESSLINAEMNLEAQQQEIRLLNMEIAELRESTQLMETVLKDARTALELLHHMNLNPKEFCFVFEVRCAIDALLGGAEDDQNET
ncbi:MAG: hypothetical protein GX997_00985 [Bacteroidales bacterium]|nr:hypothetical protein [Bacteroidales bacterium]